MRPLYYIKWYNPFTGNYTTAHTEFPVAQMELLAGLGMVVTDLTLIAI